MPNGSHCSGGLQMPKSYPPCGPRLTGAKPDPRSPGLSTSPAQELREVTSELGLLPFCSRNSSSFPSRVWDILVHSDTQGPAL
jgi:hypothetical protein